MTETGFDMPADQLLPAYLVINNLRPAAFFERMVNAGRLAASRKVLEL
jgi:hypothetical protein